MLLGKPFLRIATVNKLRHPAYLAPPFSSRRFTKVEIHDVLVILRRSKLQIAHPGCVDDDLVRAFGKTMYHDLLD